MDHEAVQDVFRGKVVLLTGAGGSIGSEVAHQLLKLGVAKLLLLDIDETELHDLCLRLLDYRMEWSDEVFPVVCDIKNSAKLGKVLEEFRPDIVIHAAAYKHVPLMELYPEEAVLNNVCGSYNVFRASKESKVGKVVVVSTDKAVNPTSVMGATKRVVEMMACAMTDDATRFCCVRFGNVLGSRGSMLPLFMEELEQGRPITVTDRDATRYFMTIPNAVELLLKAATLSKGGETFVLDMGEPVRIYDFARKLAKEHSISNGCREVPISITGLRPGEKLHEELLYDKEDCKEEMLPTGDARISIAKATGNRQVDSENREASKFHGSPNGPKFPNDSKPRGDQRPLQFTEEYLSQTIPTLFTLSPNELVAWLRSLVPGLREPGAAYSSHNNGRHDG